MNGLPILALPDISYTKVDVELDLEERKIYDNILQCAREAHLKAKEDREHIFYLLGNLIKLCNHQELVDDQFSSSKENDVEILQTDFEDCEGCGMTVDDFAYTKCSHFFCMDCAELVVNVCPIVLTLY
jgi:hypothetical protein